MIDYLRGRDTRQPVLVSCAECGGPTNITYGSTHRAKGGGAICATCSQKPDPDLPSTIVVPTPSYP